MIRKRRSASFAGEAADPQSTANPAVSEGRSSRQRSTISFPYNALEDAGELAEQIYANVGTGECSDAQLAAWLRMSAKSSTMKVRISSARTFGLIEVGTTDDHKLTDLGRRYVDPQRAKESRIEAFFSVPLYSAIFEHYKDGTIPPSAALERQIADFGVAEKQKGRARTALEKSADYAGFFDHGRNRLVKPGLQNSADTTPTPSANKQDGQGGKDGGGTLPPDIDPIVRGLIDRLPPAGSKWPHSKRKLWLNILENSFDLVYEADEDTDEAESLRKQAARVLE